MTVYKLRKDILNEINKGVSYEKIIKISKTVDASFTGFVFETICDILMASKYLINYDKYYKNHICDPVMIELTNFNDKNMFDQNIRQSGNPSDRTYKLDGFLIPTSIKYHEEHGETDLVKLDRTMLRKKCPYKLSLIVKDKVKYTDHKYRHRNDENNIVLKELQKNELLFDEKDVKIAYKMFQNKLKSQNISNIDDVIEWMNDEYLNCRRVNLKLKLHQGLAYILFKNNLNSKQLIHVLSHKPRSGKTITLLLYCMQLFNKGKNRILIMTPVPDTIDNFIKELDKYNEFKHIKHIKQKDFLSIDRDFVGVVFCSTEYLKNDKKGLKFQKLKELDFEAEIFDECHFHSSNDNTFNKIINIYDKDIIQIFASGTSNKTEYYYNIPDKCVYRWTVEDENYMRKINNSEENENFIDIMLKRHFKYCKPKFNISDYNYNYDNCPLQILLQPTICVDMINKIDEYNIKNDTDYGYNCASVLSLKPIKKNKKSDCKYKSEFQLEENSHGVEYLKRFFEMIISSDPMHNDDTIMRIIEKTQTEYNSRKSDEGNPKLFLLFLPMNSNINLLQGTIIKFLVKHKLWTEYHVCYSNSKNTSDDSNKSYLEFVEKSMLDTKNRNKKGCILLLGGQGKLGITYDDCDVTISLDNGTNIDDCKQTYYRSLTEAKDKTIGINVDLNIQRVLLYTSNRIRDYRGVSNDNRNYSEILQYLYKEKIFIFNPHEMNFGGFNQEIVEYFDKYGEKLREEISVDTITQNIICNDDLGEYIKKISLDNGDVIINPVLQGKQQNCNKGGKDKKQVDSLGGNAGGGSDGVDDSPVNEDSKTDPIPPINRSKIMYEYLSKLCCLLLRKEYKDAENKNKSNVEILKLLYNNDNYMLLINNQIKKMYKIEDCHLNKCLDKYIEDMSNYNNDDILNQIFELYTSKNPHELRKNIAAHFIPTKEQIKDHAEIPTPVECVDEMISKIPDTFWTTPKKILEPCCGKGNFVLAIFEKLYNGLTIIEDEIERCRIIIEECIYFADIEPINIFITKELLSCHAISKLSQNCWDDWNLVLKIYDFKYNTYTGDTLELDIKKEWDIEYMNASICNPPYQDNNKDGKSKHGKSNLWCKFIEYSFKILLTKGYLLFITPSSWMGGTVSCYGQMIDKQISYLNVNECKKHFNNVGSTFSYYMIENTPIYKNTKIICKYNNKIYKSEILLNNDIKILPQLLGEDTINIMNKIFDWNNDNLFIRKDLIKNKDDCINIQDDVYSHKVLTFIKKDGTKDIQYCKYKLNTQNLKKVLLFRSGYINPTYDNGECGVGNNIHYAVVDDDEEGDRLLNLYNSDLYKFMFSLCRTSQFTNGRVMNWLYKKNPIYNNIYEYFNLNEHEIKFIENNI